MSEQQPQPDPQAPPGAGFAIDPAFAQQLERSREKLDLYQQRLLERFSEYILGVEMLPPPPHGEHKDKLYVLVLVDHSDSKKMSKQ